MPINNKQYCLRELFNSADGRCLVVDTSNGLVLGTLPGLEHFTEAVCPLLPLLDGIGVFPLKKGREWNRIKGSCTGA